MAKCSYRLKDEPNRSWNDELIGIQPEKRHIEIVLRGDGVKIHRIIPWENLSVLDIIEEESDAELLPETEEPDIVENTRSDA